MGAGGRLIDPAAFGLPPWLRTRAVPRRASLSREDFVGRFAGRPFVLAGAAGAWPALTRWTPSALRERLGGLAVTVHRSGGGDAARATTLGEYLGGLDGPQEPDPWYLSHWRFDEDCPAMRGEYATPPCFDGDWLERVGARARVEMRWVFIGPAGSGTWLHVDVAGTSAWNAVVTGRKRFVFFAPPDARRVSDAEGRPADVFAPDPARFPGLRGATAHACELGPGDVVFAPSGWPHQVRNPEAGVSLTHNFVDETNYVAVRAALKAMGDPRARRLVPALERVRRAWARGFSPSAGAPDGGAGRRPRRG